MLVPNARLLVMPWMPSEPPPPPRALTPAGSFCRANEKPSAGLPADPPVTCQVHEAVKLPVVGTWPFRQMLRVWLLVLEVRVATLLATVGAAPESGDSVLIV